MLPFGASPSVLAAHQNSGSRLRTIAIAIAFAIAIAIIVEHVSLPRNSCKFLTLCYVLCPPSPHAQVLALCYDLEKDINGTEHLRRLPFRELHTSDTTGKPLFVTKRTHRRPPAAKATVESVMSDIQTVLAAQYQIEDNVSLQACALCLRLPVWRWGFGGVHR